MLSATLRMYIYIVTGLLPAMALGADPDAPEPRDAWLGVNIVPVPAAVSSQLGLDETGLMVGNVVRDSPADRAGFERYDVLVLFDGRSVPSEERAFADMVRQSDLTAPVGVELIRQGKRQTLEVSLVTRPEDGLFDYRYEIEPDVVGEEEFHFGGKMLERDSAGRWRLRDLDDLTELPEPFRHAWPHRLKRRSFNTVTGDEIKLEIVDQGRRIKVHLRKDGTIEVTRSADDQEETPAPEPQVFDSIEALQEGDPQAFGLLEDARGRRTRGLWWTDEIGRWPWAESVEPRVRRQLEKTERNIDEARRKAAEALTSRPGLDYSTQDLRQFIDRFIPHRWEDFSASTRFETTEDGRIEVHVRKGNDELTLTFHNEDELAEQKPKLFRRYQALRKDIE